MSPTPNDGRTASAKQGCIPCIAPDLNPVHLSQNELPSYALNSPTRKPRARLRKRSFRHQAPVERKCSGPSRSQGGLGCKRATLSGLVRVTEQTFWEGAVSLFRHTKKKKKPQTKLLVSQEDIGQLGRARALMFVETTSVGAHVLPKLTPVAHICSF